MTPLGKEITKRMIDMDLTGTEVSRRLGNSTSFLSAVIHGDAKASCRSVERIAEALELPMEQRGVWHELALARSIEKLRARYYSTLSEFRNQTS